MVWNMFFPKQGGGALRRWIKFHATSWRKGQNERIFYKGPVPLFDFTHKDDAADAAPPMAGEKFNKSGWRLSDDSVIGGYSTAKMQFVRTRQDLKRLERGEEPLNMFTEEAQSEYYEEQWKAAEELGIDVEELHDGTSLTQPQDFLPFIRWSGRLDTSVGDTSRVKRSGFCAIRSPIFIHNGANVGGRYKYLEMLCRSDGRRYTINLKPCTYFPDDLYQLPIQIPPTDSDPDATQPGKFRRVLMPFMSFIHTAAGRGVRQNQVKLDGAIFIENIGITLMDGVDGDFQFDLARLRVVNYRDGMIWGEDDEDAPY